MSETAWFSLFVGLAAKSTALLAAAWLASLLLRRASASARHMLWTAAAAAILALPILSVALPGVRIPVAAVLLPGITATASPSTDAAPAGPSQSSQATTNRSSQLAHWRPDWKLWLLVAWGSGVLAGLAQLLVGYVSMIRLRSRSRPFADPNLIEGIGRELGIRRRVEVLETSAGRMPMAFGILRPVVFIPSDAAGWTGSRLRAVLLHELAHVVRCDVATHWLARAAVALYWWNPLAWKMWREILAEGERAADDLVLGAGARPSEYAGHLLEIARSMSRAPVMGVAMTRRSRFEDRLMAILDAGINRKPLGRAWGFATAALAIALVAPLAAIRAQDAASQSVPQDVDAAIRSARSQKNPAILEDAAKAAQRLRQFDTAQKLLEAAVAIRGDVSGTQSKEYGVGLLHLADIEERQGHKSAEDLFEKAAQILGDRPEAGPALIHMGIDAMTKKNEAGAFDEFERAQRIDPAHAGVATMWMAVVRDHENKNDEADALYQNALARGSESPEAGYIMRVYAQFLRDQNRPDEAKVLEARAVDIQKPIPMVYANAGSPANVYRIGPGIKPPLVLSKVEPQYSEEARISRLQGMVSLQVVIGTDGIARNPQVMQALGLGLDERAIDAISQWRFQPGTKDGQPVVVFATIQVNFRLL